MRTCWGGAGLRRAHLSTHAPPLPCCSALTRLAELRLETDTDGGVTDIALPASLTSLTAVNWEPLDWLDALPQGAPPQTAVWPRPTAVLVPTCLAPARAGLVELTLEECLDIEDLDEEFELPATLAKITVVDSPLHLSFVPLGVTSLTMECSNQHFSGGMLSLVELDGLTMLEELVMINVWEQEGVEVDELLSEELAELTRLTRLVLVGFGPVDPAFLSAGSFPRLSSLCLDMYPLSEEGTGVPPLPAAAPLETLHLSLACASHTKTGRWGTLPLRLGCSTAPDLCRYPRLHTLLLHCAELDTRAARHLCAMPALRRLTLRTCKVSRPARLLLAAAPFEVEYEDDPGLLNMLHV